MQPVRAGGVRRGQGRDGGRVLRRGGQPGHLQVRLVLQQLGRLHPRAHLQGGRRQRHQVGLLLSLSTVIVATNNVTAY